MPVDLTTIAAFSVAVLAVVMSPGPDTVLILRYALGGGRRVGLAAVAGVQLGLMAHTVLAITGLSVLIASSPALFRAVAIAGAGYLAWLGWQGVRQQGALSLDGSRPAAGAGRALRDAMVTNILNPKVILLFLALYPNFIAAERGGVTAQLLTLSAVLIVINVLWQAPLAWLADAVRRWLMRPAVQRWVSQGTGGVLLLFAAAMLYEHVM